MVKKLNSLVALLLSVLIATSMLTIGAFAATEETDADITFSFLKKRKYGIIF